LVEGIAGLSDRSHRPLVCLHQVANGVEVVVVEMRRKHPRWGAKRIRMELIRKPVEGLLVPWERTIVRILARQGWPWVAGGSGRGSRIGGVTDRL